MHKRQILTMLFFVGLSALLALFVHDLGHKQTDELRQQSIQRCETANKNLLVANRRSEALKEVSDSIIELEVATSKAAIQPTLRAQAAASAERLKKIRPALTRTYPLTDCNGIYGKG